MQVDSKSKADASETMMVIHVIPADNQLLNETISVYV